MGILVLAVPTLTSAAPTTSTCPWGQFRSMFTGGCIAGYDEWIKEVWRWALSIVIPLSTLMLTAAGIIYMTSGGNPEKVGLAKKLIIGVISGVGLLILSRALLYAIGVSNAWNI